MSARPVLTGLLFLALCAPALAQQSPTERVTDTGTPTWMLAWSPLTTIADQPRGLPRAPELPGLLLRKEPDLGNLWSVGNPGALPFQIGQRWNQLRFAAAFDDGGYRRPMDPDDVDAIQFSGLGWERVGSAGAAIGRVAVDREQEGVLPFADPLEPHSSNPFVPADSSVSDMRRLRARFEGGLGWRFGDWGLGTTVGLEVRDHRADRTPLPRRGRISNGGVALGVVREVPIAGLQLGAHFRWRRERETVSVFARLRDLVVFQLQGYSEPPRRVVAPPNLTFFRRLESDAWLWGVSVSGELGRARWVVGLERSDRDHGQFSEPFVADPSEDSWEADGWTVSSAAQHAILEGRLLATGQLRYSNLEGAARAADLPGVIFRSSEDVFDATIDVRYLPEASPWTAGIRLSVHNETRLRRDFVAEVASDIDAWTHGLALEVVRQLGGSSRVSVGYSLGLRSVVSSIPDPELMGPVYQLLIAPELSLYAAQSRPNRIELSWHQRLGAGSALLLHSARESAGPDLDDAVPLAPKDSRTLWQLSISLLLMD